MELGDDLVELLLGVLGIGGELGGDVAQDCELLVALYGNADEGAIGAEELVDLFSHGLMVVEANEFERQLRTSLVGLRDKSALLPLVDI